jgi:multidrug efflux pump subunit AcrA (membrane-fusion protein)
VLFREGDEVKKGALLVKLDTQELLLRESVEAADVIRYTREAEKNLANEALADMKIAQSRVQEAKAGLDRVRFHLGQANITAPFDGIIIEGDNRKLLSSPCREAIFC